jgi:hypothetical protein
MLFIQQSSISYDHLRENIKLKKSISPKYIKLNEKINIGTRNSPFH